MNYILPIRLFVATLRVHAPGVAVIFLIGTLFIHATRAQVPGAESLLRPTLSILDTVTSYRLDYMVYYNNNEPDTAPHHCVVMAHKVDSVNYHYKLTNYRNLLCVIKDDMCMYDYSFYNRSFRCSIPEPFGMWQGSYQMLRPEEIRRGINEFILTGIDSVSQGKYIQLEWRKDYPGPGNVSQVLKWRMNRDSKMIEEYSVEMFTPGGVQETRLVVNSYHLNVPGISDSISIAGQNFDVAKFVDYYAGYRKVERPASFGTQLLKQEAVNFKAPTVGGDSLELLSIKSKALLLVFLENQRQGCFDARKRMAAMHARYDKMGLKVVAVNPLQKDHIRLKAFNKQNHIPWPTVIESKHMMKDYHVDAYPTFFLMDENRVVRKVIEGYSEAYMDSLEVQVMRLLGR